MRAGFSVRVYDLCRRIPPGRAVSYGQLARALDAPRAARQVGFAMARCPADVPWQRVVRADGSLPSGTDAVLHRTLLEAEGVGFLPDGRVDLAGFGWTLEDLYDAVHSIL